MRWEGVNWLDRKVDRSDVLNLLYLLHPLCSTPPFCLTVLPVSNGVVGVVEGKNEEGCGCAMDTVSPHSRAKQNQFLHFVLPYVMQCKITSHTDI